MRLEDAIQTLDFPLTSSSASMLRIKLPDLQSRRRLDLKEWPNQHA